MLRRNEQRSFGPTSTIFFFVCINLMLAFYEWKKESERKNKEEEEYEGDTANTNYC